MRFGGPIRPSSSNRVRRAIADNGPGTVAVRWLDPGEDLFAAPYAARDLQREDVGDDEGCPEGHEGPTAGNLRSGETEPGEDDHREPDEQAGDLLPGAARLHQRRDDEDPTPRGQRIEKRHDDEREEDREGERQRDAARPVLRGGESEVEAHAGDTDGEDRDDHPEQLSDDDVDVAYRGREERDGRAVLLLLREGGRDQRDARQRREERALQREREEGEVVRPRAAVREHERDR